MSVVGAGAGYDRALEKVRPSCFARDPETVTPVRRWEATGFTAFTSAEVGPKVASAIVVGVKVENPESTLGAETAQQVGTSGEQARFVTLARFTALRKVAGAIRATSAACLNVPSSAANGLEDFVTECGDSFLSEQTFGGHVLLSWQRSPSRAAVDELMGNALGARTVGATFDVLANLQLLSSKGLGEEELLLESFGFPIRPPKVTLPNGQQGWTVDSAIEFLERVAQLPLNQFHQGTSYVFTRYDVSQVDQCLAETGRQSSLPEAEWACVHGHLTELVDARDGTGELAHFEDRYIEAKLVRDELVPAGRVHFNTVPQSRCPGIDTDGDPNFEKSGPCQAKSVDDFVAFYEACVTQSALLLQDCRNDVLETVDTCGAFETKDCKAKELTLSSGAKVTCTEAGMAAAMADMVPWQVNPPFNAVQPPRHFQQPEVFLIDERNRVGDLPFSSQTHFCAITGIRGGLHEFDLGVVTGALGAGPDWRPVLGRWRNPGGDIPQMEVTCTAWENFHFYNGGSHDFRIGGNWAWMPQLNGSGAWVGLIDSGNPVLAHLFTYLDEAQSEVLLTNPDSSGFGTAFTFDLFPMASTSPLPGLWSVQANPPLSGAPVGGSLESDQSGRPSHLVAGFRFPSRNPSLLATQLPTSSFCYLTGLFGRYFNYSDWTRVDNSDGFSTLRASTPLAKDRNPGMRVQCAHYDQP